MVKLGTQGGVGSPTTIEVGLSVLEMFVTSGKETHTPSIDIEVVTGVKIGPVTSIWFDVPAVPTVEVTVGLGSGASFRAREVFFELTISAKVLPLL